PNTTTRSVSTSRTVSYTPATAGAHLITASYGGDTSHNGSSDMTVVTALKHATTTSVSCTPASVPVGSPSSCTATVTEDRPRAAKATSGPVSFSQDTDSTAFASCTLGSPTTNTTTGAVSTSCSVSYTPATVGAHLITASYGGDTSHNGSSDMTVVTALKHATTTSVSCTPASVPVGSPSSCTATVTDSTLLSATAPSGPVSFSQDTDS